MNDPNYGGAFIAIGFAYFFSKAVFFYEVKRMKLFLLSLLGIAISHFFLISNSIKSCDFIGDRLSVDERFLWKDQTQAFVLALAFVLRLCLSSTDIFPI